MAKILAKEKIDKVNYVWVQTSTTEAVRIKYVSDKESSDKGDRLRQAYPSNDRNDYTWSTNY